MQKAVKAALSQTYHHIEICISQDMTPSGLNPEIEVFCNELSNLKSNVKYHVNEKNLGLAGNWNQLVAIAKGEYVIIIGDDDLLAPNFIETLVDQGVRQNADVVFCDQYFIEENGVILYEYTNKMCEIYRRKSLKQGVLENSVKQVFCNSIPMSAAIIKKTWLQQFKFDSTVNTPEFEVFLKIALKKGVFFFVKEKLAFYRVHLQSATSGGLSIDRLLGNIIDIAVDNEFEQFKYRFISEKITPAVNRSLRQNNRALALKLLNSNYYPSKVEKYLQYILLCLPFPIVKKILN